MAFLGGDPETLRAFARAVRESTLALESARASISRAVASEGIWCGQDANAFRSFASAGVLPTFDALSHSLTSFAVTAESDADQQDFASAPDSASPLNLLPAPTGVPRPETIPRAGREAGRRTDGTGSDPDEGPLGNGLPDGLGEPVEGTSVTDPGMPEWHPVDEGAGDWGSEDPTRGDHANHEAATLMASLMAALWPDASENLLHFLGNSGADKEMDLDSYLGDEPAVRGQIEEQERGIGQAALDRARQSGADGPVTFPVQTGWPGVTASDKNWFYATGSGNYSMNGQVTVYPPDETHPDWRYEMDTTLNYRDQYNWDGSKSTSIDLPGPFDPTITDEQLAELHRSGLAKEFTLHGSSERRTTGP
ncbi:hypothetical protein C1N80_09465 [Brachybacterium sp. SGAir0954]|uniref:hypothetical protein n=1 Tax=Brachybacterium sp. SGAir0954 TaxID=2571029 RepID=UPI0010CD3534|nr:hypothetical protein [Brachybacterium sp. SGAir0954]QCR53781.1 hypothetical protein C1N80_09465 [Brachybacterium sp. SGAir0954]